MKEIKLEQLLQHRDIPSFPSLVILTLNIVILLKSIFVVCFNLRNILYSEQVPDFSINTPVRRQTNGFRKLLGFVLSELIPIAKTRFFHQAKEITKHLGECLSLSNRAKAISTDFAANLFIFER